MNTTKINACILCEEFGIKWLLQAIEEAAKTAVKDDGLYWRASYTLEDEKVLKLLIKYMESAGMQTHFDAVGNLHGLLKGKSDEVIMLGSHRDTVRNGGKYDGILGVLASICTVGSLYKKFGQPLKTLEVVAMVEEESSRFISSDYIGSCNIAGIMPESAFDITDAEGITIQEALLAAGYQGKPADNVRKDIMHFVELHIEQGGVLEEEQKQIGIVTSIVGQWGGRVTFFGKQNHAGTTPMKLRCDPVPIMASYINNLFKWVKEYEDEMVATIGKIEVYPGSSNVIPERAEFTFDIRSSDVMLGEMAMHKLEELRTKHEGKVEIQIFKAWNDKPTQLDKQGIKIIEQLCKDIGLSYKIMSSGAGHDSQNMAKSYPTNVIFVPSVAGISHDSREYTKAEDLEAGLKILNAYIHYLAW